MPFYEAYLKDRRMHHLNNCVDAAFFPSSSDDLALLIAQARFSEQLQDSNYFIRLEKSDCTLTPLLNLHEDEQD